MKKFLIVTAILCLLLSLAGCGEKKILHCDHCKKEVTVKASSNMEEDWTIYCEACNEKLFGDDPLLSGK